MRGIDVAKWNGNIRWDLVKKDGVKFAILKIINKAGTVEEAFERNYAGAVEQGISVGCYNYSYATTVQRAEQDAKRVIAVLNGRKMPCKVWLDVEDSCQMRLGKKLVEIIKAYQNIIESHGYEFGVYTGLSFYNKYLKAYAAQLNCDWWIARYPSKQKMRVSDNPAAGKKPVIAGVLWGWQWSSNGNVAGINGAVDMNIMYAEKSEHIMKAGNPYEEPTYTLYKGRLIMAAEYVKWLQYELNEMEYGLAVDGKFGKLTREVLIDAQGRFHIEADGKCGNITRTYLKRV